MVFFRVSGFNIMIRRNYKNILIYKIAIFLVKSNTQNLVLKFMGVFYRALGNQIDREYEPVLIFFINYKIALIEPTFCVHHPFFMVLTLQSPAAITYYSEG